MEEARRALEAERAAQLSHMEAAREAAIAEKAALAKRYQVRATQLDCTMHMAHVQCLLHMGP